jgi:hypothetical protein
LLYWILGAVVSSAASTFSLSVSSGSGISVSASVSTMSFGGSSSTGSPVRNGSQGSVLVAGENSARNRNGSNAKKEETANSGAVTRAAKNPTAGVFGAGIEQATGGDSRPQGRNSANAIQPGDRIEGLYEYRDEFDLFAEGGKRYGHYWKEVQPEGRGWGWYPDQGVSSKQAVFGVDGELNAGAPNDPHTGLYGTATRYEVYATRPFESREAVLRAIDAFANSHGGRWRLVGPNCHTFQRDLNRAIGLRVVRAPDE